MVIHEPEKRPARNYSAAVSLKRRAWDGVLTWMNRMSASKLTTGNGPGPQTSPEWCKGVAGSCWLLWAKKSLKDKFKTSLSQC